MLLFCAFLSFSACFSLLQVFLKSVSSKRKTIPDATRWNTSKHVSKKKTHREGVLKRPGQLSFRSTSLLSPYPIRPFFAVAASPSYIRASVASKKSGSGSKRKHLSFLLPVVYKQRLFTFESGGDARRVQLGCRISQRCPNSGQR